MEVEVAGQSLDCPGNRSNAVVADDSHIVSPCSSNARQPAGRACLPYHSLCHNACKLEEMLNAERIEEKYVEAATPVEINEFLASQDEASI